MNNLTSFYKDKTVLITGDTGFKGSWLAIWLLQMGAQIFGYALPPKQKQDNYLMCGLGNMYEHLNSDIRDFDTLKTFIDRIKPHIIFHLAAQPLVLDSYNDPKYTFETNMMGTVNILEAIRLNNSIRALINVTTDKVYENKEWIWGYRESDTLGGKDPYSASKAGSEIISASYRSSFFNSEEDCQIATARAGNVIGAGDWAEDRIVPDYFRAFQSGETLKVRNPQFIRPFQHVLDPLYGYLLLGLKMCEKPDSFNEAWNFGPLPGESKSVSALVETLQTKMPVAVEYGSSIETKEMRSLSLNIDKAINRLKWHPKIHFLNAIDMIVDGYSVDIAKGNSLANRIDQISDYESLTR